MNKTLVVCAILVACVALNQAAKTKTRGYPDLKTTKTRNSGVVTRNGLFKWVSFNNVDAFNTNDDGSTWNWVQNGRIIMRFGLEKTEWETNSVLTIILKRKDVENFFVKLTPYEFSWGTTANEANNFYASGNWKEFGNSLNGNAGDSTDVTVVDRSTRSSVPIPSRILKQLTAPSVRNGVFKWKNLNADKEEFFNTNDDGTVWLWFQKGRNTIQLVNSKIEWITGGVLSIILKRKDVDNFFVKLTPTEAFWGTSADAITNFYANGAWEKFGNSLTEETTNTDDVDVVGKRKRSVPIPSRYLKSN